MRLLLIALIAAGSGLSGMTSGVSKWLDSLQAFLRSVRYE